MEQNGIILVVDDEPFGHEVIGGVLTGHGYDVAFASNGEEALTKAAELTPDLMLLDVMMPDMDGYEVCQRLRSDPFLAAVPVIMVSCLDDRESRLKGIEAGADSFMSKPIDQAELLAQTQTIVRLNRYRQLRMANSQLERDITQLSTLYDISRALNYVTDIDALLGFIIRQTKKLLDVEGASIMFHDKEKDELYFPIVAVEADRTAIQLSQFRFPVDCGIAGWVFREGEPALVQDVGADDRFYRGIDDNTGFVTRAILCVPLHGRDGILGVLEVVNKKSGEFTTDDQSLLEAIADNIAVSIERADLYRDLQKTEALLRRQNAELRMAVKQKYRFKNIVGISDEVVDMLKKAEQVALTDSTVLINGETGTGKELLAQAIHQSSPRSSNSFVPINCGAVPESLLESELFGHEKGAFTGAIAQRIGRFEEANGGTLFLDEIGDMPLNLQVRLLRVLQEGVIQRLGSNQNIPVDVRVIAATYQDLGQLVTAGKFRQDLYYRLKVFGLTVPPLRERRRDILLLVNHFIKYYNEKLGRDVTSIEDAALDVLQRYDYPGNVRELQHIIESVMILCRGKTITADMLPDQMRTVEASDGEPDVNGGAPFIPRNKEELAIARSEAQKRIEYLFLKQLLSSTHGNVSEAARKSGMNRSWLTELIGKHNLGTNPYKGDG